MFARVEEHVSRTHVPPVVPVVEAQPEVRKPAWGGSEANVDVNESRTGIELEEFSSVSQLYLLDTF